MPVFVNPRTVWFGAHRVPKVNGEIEAVHNVLQAAEQWLNFCCLIRRPLNPEASVAVTYASFNRDQGRDQKPSLAMVLDRMAYESSLADRFSSVEAWEMFAQYCVDKIICGRYIRQEEQARRDAELEKIRKRLVEEGASWQEIVVQFDHLLFKPYEKQYRHKVISTYKLELELAKESKRNLLRLFTTTEYEVLLKLPRLRDKYYSWQLKDDELEEKNHLLY
jgi:hypothetical protein